MQLQAELFHSLLHARRKEQGGKPVLQVEEKTTSLVLTLPARL